jgi:P4 family phage/plasmid primase-like protien
MASGAALRQFLEEHRIHGADKRPATITGQTGGKYYIADKEYSEYLDLVHAYIFHDKGRPMNMIEQPHPMGPKPLVIDLDFRYKKDRSLDHPFENSNIRTFIEKLTEGLNTFFNLEAYESLRYFVCLRPQAYEDKAKGEIKDGIHIECPDLVLSFEKQMVLRRWMLQQDAVNEAFKGTGFTNAPVDVYDESCTRKQGWFLYGESKPNIPAYVLKTVLVYTPAKDSWITEPTSNYDDRELLELLSVRYNLAEDDNEVKEDVKPMFERMKNAAIVVPPPIPAIINEDVQRNILVQDAINTTSYDHTSFEDIELVKVLVKDCLSVERADGYDSWKRVGWCLHNISPTEEIFNLWMEFSAKSPKFSSNDIAKLKRDWVGGMRNEGDGRRLTIRSLRHWAKEDNPSMFKHILERDIADYILHSTAPTHNHVARIMKRIYQDNYAASVNTKYTDWYEFSSINHRWKKINQGIELRNKISSRGSGLEVTDLINSARQRIKNSKEYQDMVIVSSNNASLEVLNAKLKSLVDKRNEMMEINKIDERRIIDKQIQNTQEDITMIEDRQSLTNKSVQEKKFEELLELEMKLYSCGFKDNVMKECIGLFYEENFEAKLNSNPLRFGCANGVLRLDAIKPDPENPGKMKPMRKEEGDLHNFFEAGIPEDYVTFQAGTVSPEHDSIPYYEYDPSDPIQAEIADFFTKLFPRPELREWVLKLLASCLEGKNREQCYYTFQGVGSNGKSKLVDLMIMTLGDYQSSLQSTALTRKRPESGAANPDIMSIKNKRFIYMQEPDDKEPLNTSRMKQFSGEDAVEARALYGDQDRFKVAGKLFMMCNELPPINSMDHGTWRRVRLIPFESKFVVPGDKDIGKPNIFLRDMNLNSKLKKWRTSFLSLLVHIYVTQYAVSDNGTLEPAPEVVMKESQNYRGTFDSYAKFKSARIRVDRDSDEQVTVNDVWRSYRYWYDAVGGAGKKLQQADLIRRLDIDLGKPSQGKFYRGVIVFNTEEDIDKYDEEKRLEATL